MMNSKICEMLGIEFPLLAFSHCRDVVAAVSKAGGMGVFGAVKYTPEELREELAWIDAHCGGKPYGVDLIVPNKIQGKGQAIDEDAVLAALPQAQLDFVAEQMTNAGVEPGDLREMARDAIHFAKNLDSGAEEALEVAFSFPIKLIANALGAPPPVMFDFARKHGVPVAALVGAKEHAIAQINAGVDILVAAGGEAGRSIAARSPPWCWCRRWSRSPATRRCWRQAASCAAIRWPPPWRWARPAPGAVRSG